MLDPAFQRNKPFLYIFTTQPQFPKKRLNSKASSRHPGIHDEMLMQFGPVEANKGKPKKRVDQSYYFWRTHQVQSMVLISVSSNSHVAPVMELVITVVL